MSVMGRVEISIPLVTWRDGRPRFIPGAAARALGFKGEDLRHGKAGPWFSLEEAIDWSRIRVADIEAKRAAIAAGETTPKKLANAAARDRAGLLTVGQLVDKFLDNPRMKGVAQVDGKKRRQPLAPATVRGYAGSARLLRNFDSGAVWVAPAGDLTARALSGIIDKVEVRHGLAQTRALRAMLSACHAWAKSKAAGYLVRFNPVAELEETLPVLPPRLRIGSVPEMTHFVAVCDALGFPDMGDSIVLGLYTAQRQGDRLALEDHRITPEGIRFEQHKKRGAALLIPQIEILRLRLEAAVARRRPWRLNHPHVLIDEHQRRPWAAEWYRKVFRVLRQAAAFGTLAGLKAVDRKVARLLGLADVEARLAAAGLQAMASLADFRDQDLRDTAVTWLALAGCSKWEIHSITGHSLKSIDEILKHYFGAHPDLARSGMAKLEAWRKAAG